MPDDDTAHPSLPEALEQFIDEQRDAVNQAALRLRAQTDAALRDIRHGMEENV